MITNYGRHDMVYQQAIGYSCVLFAWIVVISIKMDKFCPILFLPDVCFNNFWIPLNLISYGFLKPLPINFGPIILLFITKLILPRSSFIGHLSGIIIGYPLAWGALNWLTPTILLSMISIVIIYKYNLYPGYDNNISEGGDDDDSIRYYYIKITVYLIIICNILYIFTINSKLFVLHLLSSYLAFNTLYALKSRGYRSQDNNDYSIDKVILVSASEMGHFIHHGSYKVVIIHFYIL